jgi:hypothetical protein
MPLPLATKDLPWVLLQASRDGRSTANESVAGPVLEIALVPVDDTDWRTAPAPLCEIPSISCSLGRCRTVASECFGVPAGPLGALRS